MNEHLSSASQEPFRPSVDAEELLALQGSASHEKLSEEELEEKAFEDPRVLENIAMIRSMRDEGRTKEADELVVAQKELVKQVLDELRARNGEETREEKAHRLEKERQEKLGVIKASLRGDETDTEILKAYELTDEQGQLTRSSISSPLFHDRTRAAFGNYLSLVAQYDAAAEAARQYSFHLKNFGRADRSRTEAHDLVADEVGKDLGLEFPVARRLVAKMREEIIPGSGESTSYATAVRGSKIIERYGNDLGAMVDERLEGIKRNLGKEQKDETAH